MYAIRSYYAIEVTPSWNFTVVFCANDLNPNNSSFDKYKTILYKILNCFKVNKRYSTVECFNS